MSKKKNHQSEIFDIQRKIVANMTSESWEQIPHVSYLYEADVTDSIKSMISIPKDLIDGGFNLANIAEIGITSIAMPAITAFHVNGDGAIETGSGGQLQFDFIYNITLDDISSVFQKGGKLGTSVIDLTSNDSIINVDITDKLSGLSNIDISIPEVNIPDINMPVLRAA